MLSVKYGLFCSHFLSPGRETGEVSLMSGPVESVFVQGPAATLVHQDTFTLTEAHERFTIQSINQSINQPLYSTLTQKNVV